MSEDTGRGHSGPVWGNPAGKVCKHHYRVDEGLKKAVATLLLSLEGEQDYRGLYRYRPCKRCPAPPLFGWVGVAVGAA